MEAADRAIFEAINRWPDSLQPVMQFFSEAIKGTPLRTFLALLILGMLVRGFRSRKAALLALAAWPLANGLTEALKTGFPDARPSVELSDAIIRGSHLTSWGTASSHSANMAAVALVFTHQLGWWGAPWILVALATGLSRIYMGVHYPSQVLLGWLCGTFCALVVIRTWEAYLRQRVAGQLRKEGHAADA